MHGGNLVGNGSRHGGRTAGGVCRSRWAVASLQRPRARHRVPSGADESTIGCSLGLKIALSFRLAAIGARLLGASAFTRVAPLEPRGPVQLAKVFRGFTFLMTRLETPQSSP